MSIKPALIGMLTFTALAILSVGAGAETAKEQAISKGAQRLSSDEIATRFVGKTVTFKAGNGNKTFLVYYGPNNYVSGKLVGGKWSDTGYYGVTNADGICLSWKKSDKGRLRCWTVFVLDGIVKKFNPDGSLAGDLVNFYEGKNF